MLNKRIFLGVFIFLLLAVALIAGIYGKSTQEKVSIVNNEDYEISNAISDEAPKVREITINIIETKMTVNGKEISRYLYTDENNKAYSTGYPIIANIGDTLKITVNNKTSVPTNMHWHGLEISNDQDGPDIIINPNDTHKYNFKLNQSGTYWYHSHNRPVRDQVDEGMYAPLIIKEKNDYKYDKDYIIMFDDWVTNSNGMTGSQNMDMENMNHTNHMNSSNSSTNENMKAGMMEIIGDTDARLVFCESLLPVFTERPVRQVVAESPGHVLCISLADQNPGDMGAGDHVPSRLGFHFLERHVQPQFTQPLADGQRV